MTATKQQHEKIKGYRALSEDEIALMNEGKELATKVGEYVDKVLGTPGIDLRWTRIGATSLQQGFMAVVRSIAKPSTF